MSKVTKEQLLNPVQEEFSEPNVLSFSSSSTTRSVLDELVHDGARKMLQAALEAEVNAFLMDHSERRDAAGNRLVVRNGYLPEREIQTGAGPLAVQQPRVRDKSPDTGSRVQFSSGILPKYLRKSKTIEELIPWLYLKGVSTGGFQDALQALLGENAKNISANVVVRLKEQWSAEYEQWCQRDLSDRNYVYLWADGIHVNVRLENEGNARQCMLVLMGARSDGTKELISVVDGFRESKESWRELLVDLKHRGLKLSPELAIGDGALGFWAALEEVFPAARQQRCWVHKTANVLNNLPKSLQPRAKVDLQQIWMAATRQDANKAFDAFLGKYQVKYPKACDCLRKDRDELLAFYDFPAEHWKHLRTTNPIESTFATIRHRHSKTKGSGSRRTSLAMMFKLAKLAESYWRKLDGQKQILQLIEGKKFVDGLIQDAA